MGKKILSVFVSLITFIVTMILGTLAIVFILYLLSKIPVVSIFVKRWFGNSYTLPAALSTYFAYTCCGKVSEKISSSSIGVKVTSLVYGIVMVLSLVINIIALIGGIAVKGTLGSVVINAIVIVISIYYYKESSWN